MAAARKPVAATGVLRSPALPVFLTLAALAIGVAGSLVVSVVGYRMFKALEPNFADVI